MAERLFVVFHHSRNIPCSVHSEYPKSVKIFNLKYEVWKELKFFPVENVVGNPIEEQMDQNKKYLDFSCYQSKIGTPENDVNSSETVENIEKGTQVSDNFAQYITNTEKNYICKLCSLKFPQYHPYYTEPILRDSSFNQINHHIKTRHSDIIEKDLQCTLDLCAVHVIFKVF